MSDNLANNQIITLEQLWHRHSFIWVSIGGAIFNILKDAVNFDHITEPHSGPKTAEGKIKAYHINPEDQGYITELFNEVPQQAVWHRTKDGYPLSNVLVDPNTRKFVGFNTDVMTPVWRWKYWNFAFLIFWSMLFHMENEWLRRPQLIWDKIIKLLEAIHPETITTNDYQSTYWAYLALYERILGIQHDERNKFGCYTENILNCPGLTLGEIRERKVLFDQTLDWLKHKLHNEIQHYASLQDSKQ